MKNLKKFRFTILGALALITAVTLNVRHALNDYGVKDNKLHVEVLAQSAQTSGGSGGATNTVSTGPSQVVKVHCKITTTTTTSNGSTNNGSSSNGWGAGGNIGWGGVSGGYTSGNTSNGGNSNSSSTTTSTTEEFDANKTICNGINNPCTPVNPCH